MVKRRSMVVGLGALATGSGAIFSSAAFASSVNPTADFRVVVEDDLVVEAGASFRDGNGNYQADPRKNKFYGGSSDSDLFSGESSLADLAPEDLPAAFVNNKQNSNLSIETAVENFKETYTFDNFLQVRNEGTESADIGIRFNQYGDDVTGDGPIDKVDVISAYEFFSNGGDGGKISTDEDPNGSQTLPGRTTVSTGATEQIGLTIDLSVGSLATDIADAAEPGTEDVFNGGEHDTVHLVESISIGSDSTADE